MSDAPVTIGTPPSQTHTVRDTFIVALFTFAGAILRLTTMLGRGLWLDEAISVFQATQSVPNIIRILSSGVHPPLFHILMHYWIQILGTSEFAVRSFSCVWGALAIPAAYWAGLVIYDKYTGLVAAGIVAYSPYLIWYSQEARMYSMMFFFALMSLGFLGLAVRRNHRMDWVGYGVFTGLGMFTHYFFDFLVLGEIIYVVFTVGVQHVNNVRRGAPKLTWTRPQTLLDEIEFLRPWLAVMASLALAYGLWLSKSVFMPAGGGENALVSSAQGQAFGYGQEAAKLAWRINDIGMVVVEMLTGFHPGPAMYAFVAMWPLVISFFLVMTDFLRPISRRSMLPPIAMSMMLVGFVLGMWQGQILASRYFIEVAAPAVLVASAVIWGLPRHTRTFVIALIAVLTIGFWTDQSFNPKNAMRYDYREAIAMVAQDYQPGDVIIYQPFYLSPVMNYYLPPTIPAFPFPQWGQNAGLRDGKVKLGQDLDRVSGSSNHVWVVLSFQEDQGNAGNAYNTLKWYERHGYTTVKDVKLNGVELYEFQPLPWRKMVMRGERS